MISKQSVYMKTYLSLRISLKDGRFFSSLKKNPTFSNINPRAKHVLNTFKPRTLCARLYLLIVYILFAPVISTSFHCCVNNSPDINVPMEVIETETFNVALHHNKFTNLNYSVYNSFYVITTVHKMISNAYLQNWMKCIICVVLWAIKCYYWCKGLVLILFETWKHQISTEGT